ncbi:Multidrug resistance-associated protein 5 [Orobanche hederae]
MVDQSVVDLDIPFRLGGFAATTIQLIGIVGVMTKVTWKVLILVIPMDNSCLWMQKYYMASSRDLVRIVSIQKSPIINLFGESIAGSSTIRGFGQEKRFMERNFYLLDCFARPFFCSLAAIEWLCLRMELLSTFVSAFCMVLLVSFPRGSIDPNAKAERNAKSRLEYTDTLLVPNYFLKFNTRWKTSIQMETINKKLESSEGLYGLDELVSGAKKSHGPGWLIGRHDPKCLKTSTQASAPAPIDSYVQEMTKKIRHEVVVEVEAKLNQKVCAEVDGKINQNVQDNLTLVLKKLGEANPILNVDIGEICARISNDTVGDGTPMTDGSSS